MKYAVIIEVENKGKGFTESSGFYFHGCGLICAARHAFISKKRTKSITIYQSTDGNRQKIGEAQLLEPLSESCENRGLDLAVLRCDNRLKACRPISIAENKSDIGDKLYFYGSVPIIR